MRCAFAVDIDGWEMGRDAKGAYAALRRRKLGVTTSHCKAIQEVGAWVLDTMWTVVMTNAGLLRPSAQYQPVPNYVYAHMKGNWEDEPFERASDEKIGDLWEAYGTLLFLGQTTPDWKGLRSIIFRAMISYSQLQGDGDGDDRQHSEPTHNIRGNF